MFGHRHAGFLTVLALLTGHALAQDASPQPTPLNIPIGTGPHDPIHTLHVYANLEQIPVLVLNANLNRAKPAAESRFRISLDSGPLFTPAHVRREDDDPISLAILIDATKPKSAILESLQASLAGFLTGTLHPGDRFSLSIIDCESLRTTHFAAAEPDAIRIALEQTLTPLQAARTSSEPAHACKPPLPLWDAMMHVTQELYRQPGWHVMLAVTDGVDAGSKVSWRRARETVQSASVAVFGLWSEHPSATGPLEMGKQGAVFSEDPFKIICETSGGVPMMAARKNLGKQLERFNQMIRERYIVEYPRGDHDKPGRHSIVVTILKSDDYVSPAGKLVPLADPKLLADPNTLPSQLGSAPLGTRHILDTPPNPAPN